MAAAAAGIWNQHTQAASALTGKSATPMTGPASGSSGSSSTSSSSSSSSSSATITANDFLTLLVTEMQNQDPTADTDPNEYINQLVQVNSLEQLISINQDLTPTSSTSGSASTAATASAANPVAKTAAATAANTTADGTSALNYAPGNLSVPQASSASQSVAHALDGQSRTPQTSVNGFPGVL